MWRDRPSLRHRESAGASRQNINETLLDTPSLFKVRAVREPLASLIWYQTTDGESKSVFYDSDAMDLGSLLVMSFGFLHTYPNFVQK